LNLIGSSSLLLSAWLPNGISSSRSYVACLLLLLCLSALVYYGYAIVASAQFFGAPLQTDPEFHPSVSILKPICGIDSQTYDNLASFCQQDYPDYQIIFGIQTEQDPSLAVVQQIIHDFPTLDIQFVIGDRPLGTNRKVGNLANALPSAKHDVLLLADSDVRVQPNYMQQVVQPFRDPHVGVVTCLYRSLAQGWVTALESLSATTEFHPGVLVSDRLEGIKFAMGQTIVIRRSVLEEIGGFEGIANHLADDFQLGYRAAQAGYKVALSHQVIEHVLSPSSLLESFQRQVRWMLVIRISRPWGYAGLIFTYGTISSFLFLLASGGTQLGWTVLGVTWLVRLVMAWFIGIQHLQDPIAQRLFWLIPWRDFVNFAIWCYAFTCNTVKWRDLQFGLTKDGKMVALNQPDCALGY
jgi:ceramide glucosyltransferase